MAGTERRSVVATYAQMEKAREAMAALERSGVGSDAISLLGTGPVRAAGEEDTSERDLRVATHVGSRAILGLVIGTAAGGVLALVIAAVVVGGFGSVWVWGAALAGGIGGGAVGLALGGYSTPAVAEDWELTHEREHGTGVRLEVASEDPRELETAAKVLREKDALTVEGPGN